MLLHSDVCALLVVNAPDVSVGTRAKVDNLPHASNACPVALRSGQPEVDNRPYASAPPSTVTLRPGDAVDRSGGTLGAPDVEATTAAGKSSNAHNAADFTEVAVEKSRGVVETRDLSAPQFGDMVDFRSGITTMSLPCAFSIVASGV